MFVFCFLLGLGRYLFLHVAQLVAQVAVDLQQLLDLGLGGSQRILHLLELLDGHGAVRQVRVQTLWRPIGVVSFWGSSGRLTEANTKLQWFLSLEYLMLNDQKRALSV